MTTRCACNPATGIFNHDANGCSGARTALEIARQLRDYRDCHALTTSHPAATGFRDAWNELTEGERRRIEPSGIFPGLYAPHAPTRCLAHLGAESVADPHDGINAPIAGLTVRTHGTQFVTLTGRTFLQSLTADEARGLAHWLQCAAGELDADSWQDEGDRAVNAAQDASAR